ncbi:MAG: class I SAM-dependent methyltransferase [Defluviitaleaceae bacterium]|nr:class I SAM-dependent methyltransferase [Defluviitaleaceae bacterium]MCL2275740.1 class I SAM-dependent methyltransferase [Defluviitaleaceae bacterium]
MLNNHGFDLWADGYDASVNMSDEDNTYPFAGYKNILNAIYGTIMAAAPAKVLDIGIGTGTLASKLYTQGNIITGVDFSQKMLETTQIKMPGARLIQHDFTKALPQELNGESFDFIVSTYALHHLTDAEKTAFIRTLLRHLSENGAIIIGDVGFPSRVALNECHANHAEDEWDDDEFYFVFDELQAALRDVCKMTFHPYSFCAGIIEITPK